MLIIIMLFLQRAHSPRTNTSHSGTPNNPGTHYSDESTGAMQIKRLAKKYNILTQPAIDLQTFDLKYNALATKPNCLSK